MADDILLNKVAIMERCLGRIEEEYKGGAGPIDTNFACQDSIVLNLQRICEASIDAAMHLVRLCRLGIPQESREAFRLLQNANIIPSDLSNHLQAMVGFRNIAVHDYQKLNIDIVKEILENRLGDFRTFCGILLKRAFEHA